MKFSSIAVAIALYVSGTVAATTAAGTVPLYRRKGPGSGSEHRQNRDHRASLFHSKSGGPSSAYLHDFMDALYYCEVDVGTPSQKVFVDIDTGSSDLWFSTSLPSNDCSECIGPKPFNATKSKTFVPWSNPFEIQYLDGSEATGTVAVDTVSIAGISIKDQTFGAITFTNATGSTYNGLIGLAQVSLSAGTMPAFYNMWNQKLVKSPYFSTYLPHYNNGKNSGGALTFGGVNSKYYKGKIKYYPNVSQYYYEISMEAVDVGTKKYSLAKGSTAIIDSGTTLIYAPTDLFQKLFKLPGLTLCDPSDPNCGGYYKFKCSKPPTFKISFYFNNDKYNINPADLNGGPITDNSTDCLFAIGDYGPGTNQWLVGDSFMRNYYSSFSPITEQVGFAKLKKGGVYF